MSGTGAIPPPREHPDDDLLADLAAEVLPSELSARVQAHVMGCARCAGLLAEAEGIRSLLRQSRPDTMPVEVLSRLEHAMVEARRQDAAAQGITSTMPLLDPGTSALPGRSSGTGTGDPADTRRGRRAARNAGAASPETTGNQTILGGTGSRPGSTGSGPTHNTAGLPLDPAGPGATPPGTPALDPDLTGLLYGGPGQSSSGRPSSSQSDSGETGLSQTGSGQTGSRQTGFSQTGPGQTGSGTAAAPGTTGLPLGPGGIPQGRGGDRGRRITRSGSSADSGPPTSSVAGPLTGRFSAIGADKPPSKLSRMSRPAQSARRQALEEQRSDRTPRFSRPTLQIAAAVIVVLGLGGLALHLVQGGPSGSSSGSSEASSSAASVPLLTPVQSTDTNYNRSTLKSQISHLITTSQQLTAAGTAAPQSSSQSGAKAAEVAPATGGAGQQLLRSPTALRSCLTAISAAQQPVAVDLARFAGQEAAIIVVPAAGGGYEVDVVARDCRVNADGTIAVIDLSSP